RFTPPDLNVVDGSGLSRDNRISADTMTKWLNTFHGDERIGDMFLESFAVARRSGTLKKRFEGIELHGAIVQAKSGYINEVSCLSGYVTMPDGHRRSFSIMANGLTNPGSVRLAKAMQDKIIAAIARDMAAVEITLGSD
ncbi:MAG: D-alanyl-D-alanine carboxypeptidase, partial [Planctomycetes bacterium]|nr:D-alanyl-D-alanine carboxypeptidase [Planctomycetota bacterium]